MRYLPRDTDTITVIGPFLSPADGYTPVEGLDVTELDVDIYDVNGAKEDLTITSSGGDNDMVHIANGYYSLEINALSEAGSIRITANHADIIPVWEDYEVLDPSAYEDVHHGPDSHIIMPAGYVGDFAVGSTVNLMVNFIHQRVPTIGTWEVSPTVVVFKDDDNGSPITSGVTVFTWSVETAGVINITIETDESNYPPGADYTVMFSVGELLYADVNFYIAGTFSVENRATAGAFGDSVWLSQYSPMIAQVGITGSGSDTLTLDVLSGDYGDDHFNNYFAIVTDSSDRKQARFVENYVASTQIVTVTENWSITPDTTKPVTFFAFDVAGPTSAFDPLTDTVIVGTNNDKTGYFLDTTEKNSIADAVLKRDWTAITGEANYSLLNAMRLSRNKWTAVAGVLTVYKEDGSTTAWSGNLSTTSSSSAIIGFTPV